MLRLGLLVSLSWSVRDQVRRSAAVRLPILMAGDGTPQGLRDMTQAVMVRAKSTLRKLRLKKNRGLSGQVGPPVMSSD